MKNAICMLIFGNNLYIPGNLYLDGTIITPSDAYLKDKIEDLHDDISVNLMKLSIFMMNL
jgi:hypothetical protein